jgi:phosphoesterase RecJ-like protein
LDPDGDTIGSAIGLKGLINTNHPKCLVKITGAPFPPNLFFLGKNEFVTDEFIENSLVIVIDTSTANRIFDQRYTLSLNRIKIDHHHDEGGNWIVEISGDHFAATGEIIVELAQANGLVWSKKAALGTLTAIYSDTEGLTHRQITKATIAKVTFLEKHGAILKLVEKYYNDYGPKANKLIDYIKTNKNIMGNTNYLYIEFKHYKNFS